MSSTITVIGRKKMAEARAGIRTLSPIVAMAVGDAGVGTDGVVKSPGEVLYNEVLRREVENITKVTDTCYRYKLALKKGELAGCEISELALIDAEGDVVAIKNFTKKIKDEDMEMDFEVDDNF